MTSSIENVGFDCENPYELAGFWSRVTGHPLHPDDHPGDPEAIVVRPDAADLFFQKVPEGKTVKNRVHLCLRPEDRTREAEVTRLLGLGATLAWDHRREDGSGYAVLLDPEGNEFCVLRSSAERSSS
jgi:predicted enzyme related to lactoylglutathione lyase